MKQILTGSTAAKNDLEFFLTLSADHITGATGIAPTVTLRKPGGAFAAATGAVTEIGNGWYRVAANATDNGTLGALLLHATGTGCDPTDTWFLVVGMDVSDGVRLGLTALPNAVAGAAGGLPTGDASGRVDVSKVAGTAQTARDLGATLGAAGAGLTAIGDARLANLDAAISSRSTYAGGAVASVTGNVGGNVVGSVASVTAAVSLTGDLTATMKASVTTAASAATPAVTVSDKTGFSLSAAGILAIWHQLTSGIATAGSIGKLIVDNLDVSVSSRLATSGYTAPPSAATVAAAVWDYLVASASTVGSMGKRLVDYLTGDVYARLGAPAGASVSADVAAVKADTTQTAGRVTAAVATAASLATAQADLDDIQTRLPAALVGGRIDASVGAMANDVLTAAALAASAVTEMQAGLSTYAGGDTAGTTTLLARLTALRAAALDLLDVAVSTRLATAGYTAPLDAAGTRASVGLGSANLDTQLAAIGGADPAAIAEAVMTATGNDLTPRQFFNGAAAVLLGKASGMATTTPVFRDVNDTANRVTATADADGNRTAITLALD